MTREQYILLKIMEEAAEVQQQCSKWIRFGSEFHRPSDGKSNELLLQEEWSDLMCAMQKLIDHGSIRTDWDMDRQYEASEKFEKYYELSKELGLVK